MEQRFLLISSSLLMFFIMNCIVVSAQNITLSYPEEVEAGEEFEVELELNNFSEEIYDVKIDILGNTERIANILNNGVWKSTYYYFQDAIDYSANNKESFSLKITKEYVGTGRIEVVLRNSKDKLIKFSGYEIKVLVNSNPDENGSPVENSNNEDNQEKTINQDSSLKDETDKVTGNAAENQDKNNIENRTIIGKKSDAITLVSRDNKIYKSKNEYIKQYAISGFIVFCMILVILLIAKKIKTKHNENPEN